VEDAGLVLARLGLTGLERAKAVAILETDDGEIFF
jgi:hypothetical protein